MKKLIPILLLIILSLTLSSCIKIYMPSQQSDSQSDITTDTDVSTENDDSDIITINTKTISMDAYTHYDLGLCYVKELDNSTASGTAPYHIIKSYDELCSSTEYGKLIDKTIFIDNYVLALKLNERDTFGFIGFKDVKTGTARNLIKVINDGSGKASSSKYFYVRIPKEEFNGWAEHDEIEIRKETINYVNAKELHPENTFPMYKDGEILLLTKEEMKDFVIKNNLQVGVSSLKDTRYYLVCYSKKNFGNRLYFTEPIIKDSTIILYRDYDLSKYKAERPFVHVIPIDIDSEATINSVELISRLMEPGEFNVINTQISDTAVIFNSINFYKSFNGGVYYGTELKNETESSYTIIESYREMLNKTEFYIDESIFEDNYVLALKLVGSYGNRLGFANAHIDLIDAMEGATSANLSIELYRTPYYNDILLGEEEDRKEQIEESIITTEYEYIVVPKSHLNSVRKTGILNITVNDDFYSYEKPSITKRLFDKKDFAIQSGDTWRISTRFEMDEFNRKFGTSFSYGNYTGREYIVFYLEDSSNYDILQSTVNYGEYVIYLSYLLEKNENMESEKQGYFYCLNANSLNSDISVIVKNTIITYGSYQSKGVETEITEYDSYSMSVKYSNRPNWSFKLLSSYAQFEEVFNTYRYYEADDVTADKIFPESTFDTHYVVAISNRYDADVYYNARVGGDNILYIYAFYESEIISDLVSDRLNLIAIPKNHIFKEISGVKIQYTKTTMYNGPFENVIITSQNQSDVKLESSFVVIDSIDELQSLLPSYEKYQSLCNVDFENNIILAFNRRYYTTSQYLYGDFVNFKTTVGGTASITFMYDDTKWLSTEKTYILDLVIIPKEYIKHEIKYFYVNYTDYSEPFVTTEVDRYLYDVLE